jgi:hypothetical protein
MQKFVLIISLLFSAAMGVYLGIQYPPARLKDMMEEHTSMLTEAVAHDRTNDNKAIILPTPTASLAEQTPDEECELESPIITGPIETLDANESKYSSDEGLGYLIVGNTVCWCETMWTKEPYETVPAGCRRVLCPEKMVCVYFWVIETATI